MDSSVAAGIVLAGLLCACAPGTIVPLQAAGTPASPDDGTSLLVVTRSGAPDPLRLAGTRAAYAGLDRSLAQAVREAARPWQSSHGSQRPGGHELLLELVQAEAGRHQGRVRVSLSIRATLHARLGNQYLAQTQAYCQASAPAPPSGGEPVFYECMQGIGRQLAGWLAGVDP